MMNDKDFQEVLKHLKACKLDLIRRILLDLPNTTKAQKLIYITEFTRICENYKYYLTVQIKAGKK